jgi:hypothetical protein
MQDLSTLAMAGRSKSQRRLTVDWLQPKIAPTTAWGAFRRISMTTIMTESRNPAAGGFFAFGRVSDPISLPTSRTRQVSCPAVKPVRG